MEHASAPARERRQLLRSCDACRTSKIRCLPDGDSEQTCQRCLRLSKTCVFSEARGRAKDKTRQPNTKIKEVEKRINDIYSLLQDKVAQGTAAQAPAPTNAEGTFMPVAFPTQGVDHGVHLGQFEHKSPAVFPPTPSSMNMDSVGNDHSDAISKGLLSIAEAQKLLQVFKQDYSQYCLLPPPLDLNLPTLRSERPQLLLAILMVAAQRNVTLQRALTRVYRENLAEKTIIEPKKDVDLLQGLVTYFTWYCNTPDIQADQLNFYATLLTTLANDLNLSNSVLSPTKTASWLETCRLLATVYLLSSTTAMAIRRPVPMPYNSAIRTCCQALRAAEEYPSDLYLVQLIQLRRCLEEINSTFQYDVVDGRRPSLEVVDISLNAFEYTIKEIGHPALPEDHPFSHHLRLAEHHAIAYLHEVVLHIPPPVTQMPASSRAEPSDQVLVAKYTTLLQRCLQEAKSYLDLYLSQSTRQVELHTQIEKCYMSYMIIILLRLAFNSFNGTPDDPFPLRKYCNVSQYFQRFANMYKGRALGSEGFEKTTLTDTMMALHDKLVRVKSWYDRIECFNQTEDMKALKDMSPLNFEDIVKNEIWSDDFDWSSIDFGSFDVAASWE